MKDTNGARNNWLSGKLNLGNPTMVSRNLARYRLCVQGTDPTWSSLIAIFST